MATRTPPRLMMELDQPQMVSPRSRAVLIGGLLIYAIALPIVASFASVPMSYNAGAIATASAWVTAALGGVIGILFWWHGTGTGRRGYLILASAWFYVSCLAVVFPFVYPNALVIAVPPAPMLGSSQSGGWLLAFSHLFFTSGLTAGAAVLDHDRRHARRPRLSHEPSLYLTTAAAGVLVAVAVPIILVGRLPAMNSQVGQSAPPGVFVAMSIVVLVALAGLVVTGRAFRHGSMIMRWLFTVLVVEVALRPAALVRSEEPSVGFGSSSFRCSGRRSCLSFWSGR